MEVSCCGLEVDVNGEATFMLDTKIVSSFSGRFSRLFRKSKGSANFKVIFNDFPGGGRGFELMARFCYNNGTLGISQSNIILLYSVAQFMEMSSSVSVACNLLEQTEKYLEEISYWTWWELVAALEQCQYLLPFVCSGILPRCLDSVVGKLLLANDDKSPCPSNSSIGSTSTESIRMHMSPTFWFEDFLVLNPSFIEMLVKTMIFWKVDHITLRQFLFYYQRSKFMTASSHGKSKIMEMVIDMLYTLDQKSVPCNGLFVLLRIVMRLSIAKGSRRKLENMIGLRMYSATLDNLLFPAPQGTAHSYDVNLVLRLLKACLSQNVGDRLKKIASLMDLYAIEVAPDPYLKPMKFLALVTILPDSSRESYDGMYRAMDMYLAAHSELSVEDVMKMSCGLNYGKLSFESYVHMSQNIKFPLQHAVQALLSLQWNLNKSQLVSDASRSFSGLEDGFLQDVSTDNVKLRGHLQGMHARVIELEMICREADAQIKNTIKQRSSQTSQIYPRHL